MTESVSTSSDRVEPRVFCVSLPKCGTHLLRSCLLQLGLDHSAIEVRSCRELAVQATFAAYQADDRDRWYWGSAAPLLDAEAVECGLLELIDALDDLLPGTFLNGHYAYEPRLAAALRARGIPVVVICRDPRAALLSMADYLEHRGEPRQLAQRLPGRPDQMMTTLVTGSDRVRSLQENFDAYRGWLDEPGALVVRFEDLIGPNGGGSLGSQAATVMRIVEHVGLSVSVSMVARALTGIFDSTASTFFAGRSERWRAKLGPELLALVEEHAAKAIRTWGAPEISVEERLQAAESVLARWTRDLVGERAGSIEELEALRALSDRRRAVIDQWVAESGAVKRLAWTNMVEERRSDAFERAYLAALADADARLELIHQEEQRSDAFEQAYLAALADADARLELIHQEERRSDTFERAYLAALADADARLEVIRQQEERSDAFEQAYLAALADADARLEVIRRQEQRSDTFEQAYLAALADADARLEVIRRLEARLAELSSPETT